MSDGDKKKKWKRLEKKRDPYREKLSSLFKGAFEVERKAVVKAIENNKKFEKVIDKLSKDKEKILKAGYTVIIEDFGSEEYKNIVNLKQDLEFELTQEMIDYVKTTSATQVKQIDSTTKEQIQQRIMLGQQQGLSMPKIAKLIDDLYLEQIIPNRSDTIAMTEVNSASNYASFSGAKKASEDYDLKIKKIWIATYDSRVRPTHAIAGGHDPINLNERFLVGNSMMLFPGDYAGGGEEVIRCRCAIGYVRDM